MTSQYAQSYFLILADNTAVVNNREPSIFLFADFLLHKGGAKELGVLL
jgi:hypothetical protein